MTAFAHNTNFPLRQTYLTGLKETHIMGRSHQKSTFSTVFGIKGKGKKKKAFFYGKKSLLSFENHTYSTQQSVTHH